MPTTQGFSLALRFAVSIVVLGAVWLVGLIVEKTFIRIATRTLLNTKVTWFLLSAAKISLWIIGGVVVLAVLGIDLTALVAGFGLTSLALGIALREILANALAGAFVLAYRPFRPRDRIAVSGVEGVVVEINLQHTILEGKDRKIIVPNSLFLSNAVSVIKVQIPREES